jgi:hypothetical protein
MKMAGTECVSCFFYELEKREDAVVGFDQDNEHEMEWVICCPRPMGADPIELQRFTFI